MVIYLRTQRSYCDNRGQDGRSQDLQHDEQIGGVRDVAQGVETHLAAKVGWQEIRVLAEKNLAENNNRLPAGA